MILSVSLDVVYFVENWKLKTKKKKFSGHYSLMKNTVLYSAPGAGIIKKKAKKAIVWKHRHNPNEA